MKSEAPLKFLLLFFALLSSQVGVLHAQTLDAELARLIRNNNDNLQILGIDPTEFKLANAEHRAKLIKIHHRQRAINLHPDKFPNPSEKKLANELFAKVNLARDLLSRGSLQQEQPSSSAQSRPEARTATSRSSTNSTASGQSQSAPTWRGLEEFSTSLTAAFIKDLDRLIWSNSSWLDRDDLVFSLQRQFDKFQDLAWSMRAGRVEFYNFQDVHRFYTDSILNMTNLALARIEYAAKDFRSRHRDLPFRQRKLEEARLKLRVYEEVADIIFDRDSDIVESYMNPMVRKPQAVTVFLDALTSDLKDFVYPEPASLFLYMAEKHLPRATVYSRYANLLEDIKLYDTCDFILKRRKETNLEDWKIWLRDQF